MFSERAEEIRRNRIGRKISRVERYRREGRVEENDSRKGRQVGDRA